MIFRDFPPFLTAWKKPVFRHFFAHFFVNFLALFRAIFRQFSATFWHDFSALFCPFFRHIFRHFSTYFSCHFRPPFLSTFCRLLPRMMVPTRVMPTNKPASLWPVSYVRLPFVLVTVPSMNRYRLHSMVLSLSLPGQTLYESLSTAFHGLTCHSRTHELWTVIDCVQWYVRFGALSHGVSAAPPFARNVTARSCKYGRFV